MADLNVGAIRAELSLEAQGWRQGLSDSLASLNRWNNDVGRTLQRFNSQVSEQIASAGKAMAGFGLALTAGLGGAVKVFADFDKAAREVNSIMRLNERDAKAYRTQVRDLTRDLGLNVSATEAMRGAYAVASSGFTSAADQAKVLSAGLRLSVAGGADAKETLNALTGALRAYGKGAESAADFSDILAKTVEIGQTEIKELVPTLARATTTAAQAGVPFEDLGAAIGALTVKGVPTANALDGLNQAMIQMQAPGAEAQKVLAAVGLRADTLGKTLREKGLDDALRQVFEATGGRVDLLKPILGDVNAQKIAQALGSGGGADFGAAMEGMANRSGTAMQQSAEISKAFSEQLGITLNQLRDLGISIGEALAPSLGLLNQHLQAVVGWFQGLPEGVKGAAAQFAALAAAFAVVAGGILAFTPQLVALQGFFAVGGFAALLPGISAALATVGSVLAGLAIPIAVVVAAGAALVVAWRNNWGDIQGKTQAAVEFLRGAFSQAGAFLTKVWGDTWQAIRFAWFRVVEELKPALSELQDFFGQVWPEIQAIVSAVLTMLVPYVKAQFIALWEASRFYLTAIWEQFKFSWAVISGVVATAWAVIRPLIEAALQTIRHLMDAGMALVAGDWKKMWDSLGLALQAVGQGIYQAVEGLLQRGLQAIVDGIGAYSSAGEKIAQAFIDGIRGQKDNAAQAVRELREATHVELDEGRTFGGLGALGVDPTTNAWASGSTMVPYGTGSYWEHMRRRAPQGGAAAPAVTPPPGRPDVPQGGGTGSGRGGEAAARRARTAAEELALIRQYTRGSAVGDLSRMTAENRRAAAKLIELVLAEGLRPIISSVTGGKHTSGSYHYSGMALDFGITKPGGGLLPYQQERALGLGLAGKAGYRRGIDELQGGSPHLHVSMGRNEGMALKGSGAAGATSFRALEDAFQQFSDHLADVLRGNIPNEFDRRRAEVRSRFAGLQQEARDAGASPEQRAQLEAARVASIQRINDEELKAAEDTNRELLIRRLELSGQTYAAERKRIEDQSADEIAAAEKLAREQPRFAQDASAQILAIKNAEQEQLATLEYIRLQEGLAYLQGLADKTRETADQNYQGRLRDMETARAMGQATLDQQIVFLQQELANWRGGDEQKRAAILALLELQKQDLQTRLQLQEDFNLQDVELEREHLLQKTELNIAEQTRLAALEGVLHAEKIARRQEEQQMLQSLEQSFQQFLVQSLSGQQSFSTTFANLWKSLANTVIAELAKMIVKTIAFQLVLKGLKTLLGGVFGFHDGGVVGADTGSSIGSAVGASFHAGGVVQRLHTGGFAGVNLRNDEVFAKLQTGEVVLSRDQVRALRGSESGTSVSVNVAPSMVQQVSPEYLGRLLGREIGYAMQRS